MIPATRSGPARRRVCAWPIRCRTERACGHAGVMTRRDPKAEVRQLLHELCVDLGFCLPPQERHRPQEEPPADADGPTDAVFEAEGTDPGLDERLRQQVRERADRHMRGWSGFGGRQSGHLRVAQVPGVLGGQVWPVRYSGPRLPQPAGRPHRDTGREALVDLLFFPTSGDKTKASSPSQRDRDRRGTRPSADTVTTRSGRKHGTGSRGASRPPSAPAPPGLRTRAGGCPIHSDSMCRNRTPCAEGTVDAST